jgi:hypothetical protein
MMEGSNWGDFMKSRRVGIRKLIVLFSCLILAGSAIAQAASLTNIIVTNTRDDLLVYLNVEGAFLEKMKSALLSGVPVTFSFFISLYRVRSLWLDREVADIKITHTIKYNNLKKEFSIQRSWEDNRTLVTQSFSEAQELMTEIDGLKVVPLKRLEKGLQYQIRAKAELSKITLPFKLHYVLVFVSLWDFETDWYTIDFIY